MEATRANEQDTEARNSTPDQLINLVCLRQAVATGLSADHPHKEIILEARNSAQREIKYRFAMNRADLDIAKKAIRHVLDAVRNDPRKFWLLGNGTGSFDHLTRAAAALWNEPIAEVRENFQPRRDEYQVYCDQKEADERLLTYCRENGITGKRDE